MAKNSEFFDRLVERLDQLDPNSVQGYMLKLVRERGLLSTVFQTIREGVIIIDRCLTLQFVNNAAITILGLPPEVREREGLKINRYLRDLDWERLISQDPDEWERISRQEIEVFYPRHRVVQFYLLPYKSEFEAGPELGNAIIILHDITELSETTQSTIESERLNAITMLAAGVAHEIGNPLNSLTIHLKLLDRFVARLSPDDRAEAQELIDVSRQEVRRLDGIITQFLKAVRPDPPNLQPVDLTVIVSDTLRFMKQEIEDRGVDVECIWAATIPEVPGDADQLRQAFFNIINNAIQAMPEGGRLQITVTATDLQVDIAFADTGKGIPADKIANIFDPYVTTRGEGTGLGLVIVERIVREHGAELHVESAVGKGTVFSIVFPRREKRTRLLT